MFDGCGGGLEGVQNVRVLTSVDPSFHGAGNSKTSKFKGRAPGGAKARCRIK